MVEKEWLTAEERPARRSDVVIEYAYYEAEYDLDTLYSEVFSIPGDSAERMDPTKIVVYFTDDREFGEYTPEEWMSNARWHVETAQWHYDRHHRWCKEPALDPNINKRGGQ